MFLRGLISRCLKYYFKLVYVYEFVASVKKKIKYLTKMQKGYKISFVIYSGMLIFSILFMLLLWGASGHKITLKYYHYLIALFAIINILLLLIFPRISIKKNNMKFITGLSILVYLLVYIMLHKIYFLY
jgi:hypothetical protein